MNNKLKVFNKLKMTITKLIQMNKYYNNNNNSSSKIQQKTKMNLILSHLKKKNKTMNK